MAAMADDAYGIPDDAKEGKADPGEDAVNAKAKVAIHAAFQAGEELELKLAVDLGGGIWVTIEGADVPVDKVG